MNAFLSVNSSFYSFSWLDVQALAPLLILLVGALIVLLIESFSQNASKKVLFWITFATIFSSIIFTNSYLNDASSLLKPWLSFDSLSKLLTYIFLFVGLCSILLASAFFEKFQSSKGEFYFLLLSALFGLILIGSAADFLTLFLGLETLSIALYVLCGYMKKWEISHEASIKYFLMGSIAAAFLLYGIALIYGAIGNTSFSGMLPAYQDLKGSTNYVLFFSGVSLVSLGLAFKAAVVPFHTWAPDVYDGAPTPVTAFMAVGTKIGAFAALIRVFYTALPQFHPLWNQAAGWLAYPTLIYSNFVAMRQQQLRRFFAYSGISHAGFLLIPLAVGTPETLPAMLFYFVIYGIATMGCFAILTILDHTKDGVLLDDLSGLFKQSPFLATVFSLCLLTLAGIPPTAGFFAKFYLFKLAYEAGYLGLVIVGLLTTILSAYYYLRIISIMISDKETAENKYLEMNKENQKLIENKFSFGHGQLLAVLCLGSIVFFSLFPGTLLQLLTLVK